MPEFELQKGEKIIEEIKPIYNNVKYHIISGFGLPSLEATFVFFLVTFILTLLTLPIFNLMPFDNPFILSLSLSAIISISLTYKWAINYSNRISYWITNKRIVIKKGWLSSYFVSIYYKRIKNIEIVPTEIKSINL